MSGAADSVDPRLLERLDEASKRFEDVEARLSDPAVFSDQDLLRELGRERAHLEAVVRLGGELRSALEGARDASELLEAEEDPDMRELAQEELDGLEARIPGLA